MAQLSFWLVLLTVSMRYIILIMMISLYLPKVLGPLLRVVTWAPWNSIKMVRSTANSSNVWDLKPRLRPMKLKTVLLTSFNRLISVCLRQLTVQVRSVSVMLRLWIYLSKIGMTLTTQVMTRLTQAAATASQIKRLVWTSMLFRMVISQVSLELGRMVKAIQWPLIKMG